MLLAARDEDGSQMNDRQLRDEVMTLFSPGMKPRADDGVDVYLLGRHPKSKRNFTPSSMKYSARARPQRRICRA